MQTEAQKRASKNYASKNVKTKTVNLYPKDADIVEFLETLDVPFGEYVRGLIRDDMARRGRADA